jgi:hypothetical protein
MQDTYDKETAEFIATICRSIPHLTGDVMRGWIENPAALKSALRRVLCSPQTINPAQPPPREFAIWKRIKLGTHKDAAGLKRDLENGGITLSEWAADIIENPVFTLANQEMTVDLVNVRVAELGFTTAAPLREIHARALTAGLQLCPPAVGPEVRRQYLEQPLGECLGIAMEPIRASDGHEYFFRVLRGPSGLCLRAFWSDPDGTWFPDDRFIFAGTVAAQD